MLKKLSIDEIYDPEKKILFDGSPQPDVIWIDDNHFIQRKTDSKSQSTDWLRVNVQTGETVPFIDAGKMEGALKTLPGISEDDAKRLSRLPNYVINASRSAVLINHANDLFLYKLEANQVIRLTTSPSPEVGEEFSPDGKLVSFVRDNNLYVVDIETRREWALTGDSDEKKLNGRLDWVYQEEIYGRGNFKGYWWSPDSRRVAYLQLDESPLKEYPVTDHIPYHPELEKTNYPLAGDPNPKVRLGVVNVLGGVTQWIDTFKYETGDFLIVRVGWTPDSRDVVFQVQDREQRWLDLNIGAKTVLREQRETWVEVTDEAKWLKDGSFLWLSERTGWRHLYHYRADGTLIRAVTGGKWEVRTLLGVAEDAGSVFFNGTKDSPIGNQTYRARLDGTSLERLTQSEGSHRSIFSPSHSHFVDYWSDIQTPAQMRLYHSDGTLVRVVDENRVDVLKEYALGSAELVPIRTNDGFAMETMMIKPPDFDPTRKHPVLVYTYSGPRHPQVVNAWGGEKYMWHQMLAQMGYIIWICDNRSASGKGCESAWPAYRNLGELELRDLEESIDWLKVQPFVDSDRIGLWGWSYGGYITSYALTHSHTFKMGIAGAPVTDWRNYDSVYTERYMATPQNNPEGYEKSSVVKAAANLHGQLLLVHGATDDNVHVQNTIQLAYELQKAGKQFELMLYPRTRHTVTDPLLLKHLRTLMTEFVVRNL
jgi:dipeptidyl-peptidase-4